MSEKHKIFIFNNGGSRQWYEAAALADDGVFVAGHVCSGPGWMPHDMGITSDWKHEDYDKHFGAGNWELEWVDDPRNHEGVKAAYEKHLTLGVKGTNEDAMPKIEVTFSD